MFLLDAREHVEQAAVRVVVPNQKPVLFSLEPALLGRENAGLGLGVNFKLQVVLCRNVARQFLRFDL